MLDKTQHTYQCDADVLTSDDVLCATLRIAALLATRSGRSSLSGTPDRLANRGACFSGQRHQNHTACLVSGFPCRLRSNRAVLASPPSMAMARINAGSRWRRTYLRMARYIARDRRYVEWLWTEGARKSPDFEDIALTEFGDIH